METAAWELNALEVRLGTDILIAIIVGRSIFVSAISYYDASAHPDNITIFVLNPNINLSHFPRFKSQYLPIILAISLPIVPCVPTFRKLTLALRAELRTSVLQVSAFQLLQNGNTLVASHRCWDSPREMLSCGWPFSLEIAVLLWRPWDWNFHDDILP